MVMEERRQFSREFKLEAVKLVKNRGVSVAQAARDLDVHENVCGGQVILDRSIGGLRCRFTLESVG